MASAPSPRPTQGFSSEHAQQWVLASAILLAVTYTFRRLIEPSVSAAPAKGSKASALLGAGSPPPPLGQWAVSFGAAFTILALMTLAAPELAASLALMAATGSLLTNGISVVADLDGLEGNKTAATAAKNTQTAGGTVIQDVGTAVTIAGAM
jgi:hypothetical protein